MLCTNGWSFRSRISLVAMLGCLPFTLGGPIAGAMSLHAINAPRPPQRIHPDDLNHNRIDDELEELVDNGEEPPFEFFVEFDRTLWETYRADIKAQVQAVCDNLGNGTVADDYYLFPGLLIGEAELQAPLWEAGEYLDPLIYALFNDMEVAPQMLHALHWFYPAGDGVPDYLTADRICPQVWEPQYLPDTTAFQPSGYQTLIAVLDTGVDSEGIDAEFVAGGYDVASGNEGDPSDLSAGVLDHGTQVAYLAQGWGRGASNEYGAAPMAALLDVRIVDPSSTDFSSSTVEILKALDWVHNNRNRTFYIPFSGNTLLQGIDAVNISFADHGPTAHRFVPGGGGSGDCDNFVPASGQGPLSLAVDYMVHHDNIPVVVAAGNCGEPPLAGFGELAAARKGITVGAYAVGNANDRSDDQIYSWSNHDYDPPRSQKPDLVAPGDAFGLQGTSFAAPQVVGAVALMHEVSPDVTAAELRQLLRGSASLGYHDPYWGHGVLDAEAALNALP